MRSSWNAVGKESVLLSEHIFKSDQGKQFILQVRKGDLTMEKVDAIVNAANCRLQHISGLAGAIVKNGGKSIQIESNNIIKQLGRELENGEVVETSNGDLPCKIVFHAVGPIWSSFKSKSTPVGTEQEDFELSMCVEACLTKALEKGLNSLSIPAISSGIFGYPKDRCAKVLFNTVEQFFKDYKDKIPVDRMEVRFTNFDDETCNIFSNEFKRRY
ncbi:hypothetical protein C9374_014707 [Naegleria lovaniensis]|uniref:Macro domain-containing protein n=1 Tax=Naegleria lovaniensis TaxID=51637 RepID=A0AA88KB54_NAELO|nr:uncharacterized protein C9374_014707 [Naegleria lovaniensis]KAG2370644.1 hypothetical protein C9374_014707 [Naegleria lovaniensis]